MKKVELKNCSLSVEILHDIICIAVFGSYHEESFNEHRSDIDIMILCEKALDINREVEIQDYLQGKLGDFFQFDNFHFTFISDLNYPFSELLISSNDKLVYKEERYLDYVLAYSTFKRDRENLEIMRECNNKELEECRRGILYLF